MSINKEAALDLESVIRAREMWRYLADHPEHGKKEFYRNNPNTRAPLQGNCYFCERYVKYKGNILCSAMRRKTDNLSKYNFRGYRYGRINPDHCPLDSITGLSCCRFGPESIWLNTSKLWLRVWMAKRIVKACNKWLNLNLKEIQMIPFNKSNTMPRRRGDMGSSSDLIVREAEIDGKVVPYGACSCGTSLAVAKKSYKNSRYPKYIGSSHITIINDIRSVGKEICHFFVEGKDKNAAR